MVQNQTQIKVSQIKLIILEILRQELSNENKLIHVVSNLSTESLPARNVLIAVIHLLLHPDSQVQNAVKQYFSNVAVVRSRRQQVSRNSSHDHKL